MKATQSENPYDAVVIGAGIGGLICGCYLARAGMKVLICEQHSKPGGYCTSFTRRGFQFDAAAHSFGGYRKGGIVRKVLEELDIHSSLRIRRFDPIDIVVCGKRRISFWADTERTIDEIGRSFPGSEEQVRNFFAYITATAQGRWAEMRNWTFGQLLDRHISDCDLKSMLSFPLYGDGGLPPSRMSAFIGARIFHEFLIDGGYYPEGGMQSLPDMLASRFVGLGGSFLFSSRVVNIPVEGRRATGIELSDGTRITGRRIISNADSSSTFLTLLGHTVVPGGYRESIELLKPSLSLFILYAGMRETVTHLPSGANVWFMADTDLDAAYRAARECDTANIGSYMVRSSPDASTVLGFFNVACGDGDFWTSAKEATMHAFIRRIGRDVLPGFEDSIAYCEAATPRTLRRFTSNREGAAYGWACTPDQVGDVRFRKPPFLDNVMLTGHWSMQGLGIPGVVYAGMETARHLLREHHKETRSHAD